MQTETPPSRLALGIAISLIAYLFFVTASSLVWGASSNLPTIQIIFFQNVVSLLCTLPLLFVKKFPGFKTKVFGIHLIRDLMGVLSYYLYFVAIRFLNLVDATTLNYTTPFFVPFIWWLWMKERVPRNVWWSIVLGFIGIAVILNPSRQIFQAGFVFGIFAAITSAIALCAVRVLHLHLEPTRRTLIYYFLVGSIVSLPFAIVYWAPLSSNDWLRVIGIGVATALGQICLTIAYRYGTASYLSPLGYMTVVYAGFISYFLFNKPISLSTLIGAVLIILGGSLTYMLKRKPHSIAETFETRESDKKPPL